MEETSSSTASLDRHLYNNVEMVLLHIPHARITALHIFMNVNLSFLAYYSFGLVSKRCWHACHWKTLSSCKIPPELSSLLVIHGEEMEWEMGVKK